MARPGHSLTIPMQPDRTQPILQCPDLETCPHNFKVVTVAKGATNTDLEVNTYTKINLVFYVCI